MFGGVLVKVGGKKGSITIFMCIVISVVIVLTGFLVDATRISMGSNIVDRSLKNSADSVLAGYEKTLKELFGIFAMANDDEQILLEELEKYFSRTLITELGIDADKVGARAYNVLMESIMSGVYEDARFTDLYDFQIEALSLEKRDSLIERDVFRNQILEHMRYRAPRAWIGGFLERIQGLEGVRRQTKTIENSVELDKMISEAKEKMVSLSNDVEIANRDLEALDDILGNIEKFIKSSSQSINYEKFLPYLNDKLSEKENEKRETDYIDEETGELVEDSNLKSEISALQRQIGNLRRDIIAAKSQARNQKLRVIDKVEDLKRQKTNILGKKQEVREKNKKVLDEANLLIGKLDGDNSEFANNLRRQTKLKVDPFKENLLDQLRISTKGNMNVLESLKASINTRLNVSKSDIAGGFIPKSAKKSSELSDDPTSIIGKVEKIVGASSYYKEQFLENLKDLDFKRSVLSQDTEIGEDPREEIAESANEQEVFEIQETDLKDEQKQIFLRIPSKNDQPSEIKINSFENDFDQGNGNDSKVLNESAGMFEIFEQGVLNFRDELYINEYIIQTFKNATSNLDDGWEKDFRGVSKGERATFFDIGEAEYVIGGSGSEGVNLALVKSQIFMMRFALNSIYVYTDPALNKQALSLATAAAGWWTGGLGIPIMHNIILLTLAFSESVIDVNNLLRGKRVPIFKTRSTWNVSLTGLKRKAVGQAQEVVSGAIDTGIDFLSDEVRTIKVKSYRTLEGFIDQKVDAIIDGVFSPLDDAVLIMESKLQGHDTKKINDGVFSEKSFQKTGDPTMDLIQEETLRLARESFRDSFDEIIRDINSLNSQNFYQEAINIQGRIENIKDTVREEVYENLKESFDGIKKNLNNKIDSLEQKGREYIEGGVNSFFASFDKSKDSGKSVATATSVTAFSYSDYLRLLLLMVSSDRKILRIQDLIQLNMEMEGYQNFEIAMMHTGIDVETTISLKYLFMTARFMPKTYKTSDGRRHRIMTNFTRGYAR